jgi:hypothetical protein
MENLATLNDAMENETLNALAGLNAIDLVYELDVTSREIGQLDEKMRMSHALYGTTFTLEHQEMVVRHKELNSWAYAVRLKLLSFATDKI